MAEETIFNMADVEKIVKSLSPEDKSQIITSYTATLTPTPISKSLTQSRAKKTAGKGAA